MRHSFALVWFVFSFICGQLPSSAFAQSSVEARGLRVTTKGYDESLKPFHSFGGTAISFLLQMPNGGLISYDHTASVLKRLVDDTGRDLLNAPKISKFAQNGFQMMSQLSGDTKALLFEVGAGATPAPGAKTLSIEAEVAVKVATKSQVAKGSKVTATVGQKVLVGEFEFEITQLGKPQWDMGGKHPLAITFTSKQDPTAIKNLSFFDDSGNKLSVEKGSSSRMGFNNNMTYTQEYKFTQTLSSFSVEADIWQDLNQIKVPFQMDVSIGL